MISVGTALNLVEVGSLLVLLGYAVSFAVFWRQLVAEFNHRAGRTAGQPLAKRANVLIDPGDGKPVPLDESSKAAVHAAIAALEERLKA